MAYIDRIDDIGALKKIVEQMHKCCAQFIESVPVSETFKGQTVWEGIVHVFGLEGHPLATKCYAWSSPIEGSTKRRFYAVLNIPPVDSSEKAIRAELLSSMILKRKMTISTDHPYLLKLAPVHCFQHRRF